MKFDPHTETPIEVRWQRLENVLTAENPDWEAVNYFWKRLKYDHKLTNDDIAAMFAGKYKSGRSFEKSTAYREMVTGLVRFYLKVS